MIANENDLLGVIINNVNDKNECGHSKIVKSAGIDWDSYSVLVKSLEQKHCIRADSECVLLLSIGRNNYISKKRRFASWILKMLVLTIKELFVFLSGVASGLIVSYFAWKFGWL